MDCPEADQVRNASVLDRKRGCTGMATSFSSLLGGKKATPPRSRRNFSGGSSVKDIVAWIEGARPGAGDLLHQKSDKRMIKRNPGAMLVDLPPVEDVQFTEEKQLNDSCIVDIPQVQKTENPATQNPDNESQLLTTEAIKSPLYGCSRKESRDIPKSPVNSSPRFQTKKHVIAPLENQYSHLTSSQLNHGTEGYSLTLLKYRKYFDEPLSRCLDKLEQGALAQPITKVSIISRTETDTIPPMEANENQGSRELKSIQTMEGILNGPPAGQKADSPP